MNEKRTIILRAGELSAPFRLLVAEEADRHRIPPVVILMILRHLLQHPEINTPTVAQVTHQSESDNRKISHMEPDPGYLERGETGRGTYYS